MALCSGCAAGFDPLGVRAGWRDWRARAAVGDVEGYLAFAETFAGANSAERSEILSGLRLQAQRGDPSLGVQLQLGLALAEVEPRRAKVLLGKILESRDQELPPSVRALVALRLSEIEHRNAIVKENQRLRRQREKLEQDLAEARATLDALATIEQTGAGGGK